MNREKEQRAINYLKMFEPKAEPYYLCYSGGKDSDVILTLAKLADVNFEAVHNLTTVDDMDEDILNNYEFEYHGKEQESLLRQTIYKVTNSKSSMWGLRYTYSGRKCKTRLGGQCTAAQKVEIDFLFDFYKRLWEKERKALLSAFIQKHRIFGELKDGEEPTELSDEETEKIFALMRGLSDESPQKQIEEQSKWR